MKHDMEICDDGHGRIVHTESECPLCDQSKILEEIKDGISSMSDDLIAFADTIGVKRDVAMRMAGGYNSGDEVPPEFWRIARLHPIFSAAYLEDVEYRLKEFADRLTKLESED
jgi:hypothetical protein